MPRRYVVCLMAAGLLLTLGGAASAQSPANPSAEQNVRQSQEYERALCTNKAFRDKRIAQECGPVTDPQLHQSCVASFECGGPPRRGSQKAPPSETIR